MQSADRREQSLERRGLTANDSRAPMSLDIGEGQPVGALARGWICDPSTATWVIGRLEREGLAERRPSPGDRRVKPVGCARKGARVRAELMAGFHGPPEAFDALGLGDLEALKAPIAAPPPARCRAGHSRPR